MNNSSSENKENTLLEHKAAFPSTRVPRTLFDEALTLVAGVSFTVLRDGRREKMRAALDYRATWGQIKHWRAGRHGVPQWAIDTLREKADQQRDEATRASQAAKNQRAGPIYKAAR